jgi:hypothetical protein
VLERRRPSSLPARCGAVSSPEERIKDPGAIAGAVEEKHELQFIAFFFLEIQWEPGLLG